MKNGFVINRSVTEYSGRRNCNKFTKLYDKTKESHLDYDLTRLEYTFVRDEEKFDNLPSAFVISSDYINNLDFTKLSDSDLVLVDLLRNNPDFNFYYKRLGYRLRKKLKPFLMDYEFFPDISVIKSLRSNLLLQEL